MKILVFGDSHSHYFNMTNEIKNLNEDLKGINIKVIKIHGASIKGFGRRNGTIDSIKKLHEEIDLFQPDIIVIALGQVDVELGYYYKTIVQNENISFNDYIEEIVKNFIPIIKSLPQKTIVKGINQTILCSMREKAIKYTERIITENITDHNKMIQMKKILREKFPSNIERINNHNTFNDLLRKKVEASDILYFDINKEVIRKDGKVKLKYIPASFDHHFVDSIAVRQIHLRELLKCIFKQEKQTKEFS